MTIRYMLDTNTISFHLRRSSAALQQKLHATPATEVALSVVTEMELRFGLARNPSLKIRPMVETLLAGISVLPLDSAVASAYGRVQSDLESRGVPIGPLDLMIASHALALDLVLVTNNLREMGRVDGLCCEDWTR